MKQADIGGQCFAQLLVQMLNLIPLERLQLRDLLHVSSEKAQGKNRQRLILNIGCQTISLSLFKDFFGGIYALFIMMVTAGDRKGREERERGWHAAKLELNSSHGSNNSALIHGTCSTR